MQALTLFLNEMVGLTEREAHDFDSRLIPKNIKKGEVLFPKNTLCKYAAFVGKGLLAAIFDDDGIEMTVHFYRNNSFAIDYPAFLLQKSTDFEIVAIEDSELILLSFTDLQELYASKNYKWNMLGRLIAEKTVIHFINRQKISLLKTPKERYENFVKNYPDLHQRITQYQLASYLGIRPESLSRIKNRIIKKEQNS